MERKKQIQKAFFEELGLVIDQTKQGLGSSNDGNTARRFFDDWETSARLTSFNEDLLHRFKVLLDTISCGFEINIEKYRIYALETAEVFVKLYPWYPMPPTVHKILIHGHEIIQTALLPIGQLSEEAQEARNKEFKR